jgi:hypothetical protein
MWPFDYFKRKKKRVDISDSMIREAVRRSETRRQQERRDDSSIVDPMNPLSPLYLMEQHSTPLSLADTSVSHHEPPAPIHEHHHVDHSSPAPETSSYTPDTHTHHDSSSTNDFSGGDFGHHH